MSGKSYIITYPITAGKQFNLVLSYHRDHLVDKVEDVDMDEFRKTYEKYDPRIERIVDMVPTAQRWPLLVTGPLKSWSSPQKNIELMGDAAHSLGKLAFRASQRSIRQPISSGKSHGPRCRNVNGRRCFSRVVHLARCTRSYNPL
jgi:hypothetical protein